MVDYLPAFISTHKLSYLLFSSSVPLIRGSKSMTWWVSGSQSRLAHHNYQISLSRFNNCRITYRWFPVLSSDTSKPLLFFGGSNLFNYDCNHLKKNQNKQTSNILSVMLELFDCFSILILQSFRLVYIYIFFFSYIARLW